jgi:hypothetical protein
MDLASLDTQKAAEQGFELQLEDPFTGEPIAIWITVLGADSSAYQQLLREQNRRRTDLLAKRKQKMLSPEDIERDTIELLAAVTTGWRAGENVTLDGQPFPAFSRASARDLYSRPGMRWIAQQVDRAMGDRQNFLPRSAKS